MNEHWSLSSLIPYFFLSHLKTITHSHWVQYYQSTFFMFMEQRSPVLLYSWIWICSECQCTWNFFLNRPQIHWTDLNNKEISNLHDDEMFWASTGVLLSNTQCIWCKSTETTDNISHSWLISGFYSLFITWVCGW